MANAGLLLPVTLAHRLGLGELADSYVDLGDAPGRTNAGDKLLTDDQFVQKLGALIRRLSAEESARRVPSRQQCRSCAITVAKCPERVEAASGPENPNETTSDAVRVIAVQGTPWNNAGRFLRRCPFTRAVVANNSIRGDKRASRRCHCRHHRRRDHRVFR